MSSVANHAPEVVEEVNARDEGDHRGKPIRKPRKPHVATTPATGHVRVLRAVGELAPHAGEIAINDQPYYLYRTAASYRLTGYDRKAQEVKVYDLPIDLSSCDCPDGTYHPERPGGCKHRRALAALVAAGKL